MFARTDLDLLTLNAVFRISRQYKVANNLETAGQSLTDFYTVIRLGSVIGFCISQTGVCGKSVLPLDTVDLVTFDGTVCMCDTAGTQRAHESHGGREPSEQFRQSPVVGGGEAAEADA